jgi:glyoxylase-like metal-dependent hydrolase (beta-lactamase superfamily II)
VTLVTEAVEPGVVRLAFSGWRGRSVGYVVSAYVIDGVLIDTAYPNAAKELLPAVEQLALRGAIVTHWHEDHAGSVAALAERGLPMHIHPLGEAALRALEPLRYYRRYTWGRNRSLRVPLRDFDFSPLQVIATPGHTEDHIAVWHPERRILATGDLFIGVKVRVAHDQESPRDIIASLRMAMGLEPRLLLDAHRGVVRNPLPLIAAKIDWMEETIGAITVLADEGCSEREIQRRVLGREAAVGWASRGEYSKRALVRSVLRDRTRP